MEQAPTTTLTDLMLQRIQASAQDAVLARVNNHQIGGGKKNIHSEHRKMEKRRAMRAEREKWWKGTR